MENYQILETATNGLKCLMYIYSPLWCLIVVELPSSHTAALIYLKSRTRVVFLLFQYSFFQESLPSVRTHRSQNNRESSSTSNQKNILFRPIHCLYHQSHQTHSTSIITLYLLVPIVSHEARSQSDTSATYQQHEQEQHQQS
jgi:hypothetical protein